MKTRPAGFTMGWGVLTDDTLGAFRIVRVSFAEGVVCHTGIIGLDRGLGGRLAGLSATEGGQRDDGTGHGSDKQEENGVPERLHEEEEQAANGDDDRPPIEDQDGMKV